MPRVLAAIIVVAALHASGTEETFLVLSSPPPEHLSRMHAGIPSENAVILPGVPNYLWSYGCAPTSAAMLLGFHAQAFPELFDVPVPMEDGGTAPLHASAGHRADHYEKWLSRNDPYYGKRVPHTDDCLADFMGSNRQTGFGNADGESKIYWSANGSRNRSRSHLNCLAGMIRYAESRGFGIADWYCQATEGESDRFRFEDYVAEIDAGRPVLVVTEWHMMLGVGYDMEKRLMAVHDTAHPHAVTYPWEGRCGPYGRHVMCAVLIPGQKPEERNQIAVYEGTYRPCYWKSPRRFRLVFGHDRWETGRAAVIQGTDAYMLGPDQFELHPTSIDNVTVKGKLFLPWESTQIVVSGEGFPPRRMEGNGAFYASPEANRRITSVSLSRNARLTRECSGLTLAEAIKAILDERQ
jgi:hypothetical protein